MPSIVVLAHPSHQQAVATRVSDDLAQLGYAVDQLAGARARRAQASRIEAAQKVIVLWSRAARGTPALMAAVRRARAKGTLVCVALDGAPPPAGVAATMRMPRHSHAWRAALAAKRQRAQQAPTACAHPRPARARRDPKLRVTKQFPQRPLPAPPQRGAPALAVLTAFALVAAAAGTEAYARDPSFAHRFAEIAAKLKP